MTYPFPMEMNFIEDRKINYYLNFGIQSATDICAIPFYILNFTVFLIFSINLIYELKFIAKICQNVGNTDPAKKCYDPLKGPNTDGTSAAFSHNLLKDYKTKTIWNAKKAIMINPETNDETITLFAAIVKYHAAAVE